MRPNGFSRVWYDNIRVKREMFLVIVFLVVFTQYSQNTRRSLKYGDAFLDALKVHTILFRK